ncbi:unnamed protein product [Brassica rapa]|uniref:Uncharacterized protein n=1 Tax=Brassica campestris TaxID=3711 RepID=A0A3P6BTS4_BRACM|nr:unnamed protein product [Brassica rapa]VDD04494.1 unnamed protein product [Brassica rapa]
MRLLEFGISRWDIWAYSSNSSYTVKSGYKLAAQAKEVEKVQAMNLNPGVLDLKRTIWNCNFTQDSLLLVACCFWCTSGGREVEYSGFKFRLAMQDMQVCNRVY